MKMQALQQVNDSLRVALAMRSGIAVVLQTEAAECGLACVAMVLGHYGMRTDLLALRRRHSVSLTGMTLETLIQAAAVESLATRALRLEVHELKDLRTPCVLHWDLCHFVVLKSVTRHGAVLLDPARGEYSVSREELSKRFTGVALEMWPAEGFRPRNEKTQLSLRQLVGQVRGLGGVAARLLAFSIALEVFSLLHPQLMQWVTDEVLVSRDHDLLTVLAIGFILITVIEQGLTVLRGWLLNTVSASLRMQWRSNVFTHMLQLPVAYFQKRHLGDVVSRFKSIDNIQDVLTTTFIEALLDGVMGLVALGLMFLYSPALAMLAVVAVALYGLIRWALFKPMLRAREEEIVREALQSSHVLESIRGIRALKLFARQHERRADWQTLLAAELNAGLKVQALQLGYNLAAGLIAGLATVAVLWWGSKEVLAGSMTLGMLLAFVAYRSQFHQRSTGLIGKIMDLRMLRLDAQRLADIVLTPTEQHDTPQLAQPAPQGQRSMDIELRALRFRYSDHEPWVLDGLNLRIPEGQCVAIVGPSGCGKTTLVNVLLGDLNPEEGSIFVGGIDLRRLGHNTWRSMVGAVMQDDALFAGTLADNISFFDPRIDLARVETCARFAAVWDDIQHMPMGIHTLAGDMGTSLSGGQKQRVLLARALYKLPRLLVLDEATSHLDVVREAKVNAAVARLGITRILVAHRPETVAAAQRVVALEDGRVVYDGAPAEYLSRLRGHSGGPWDGKV